LGVTHLHQYHNKYTWFLQDKADFSNIDVEKLVVAWEEEED
jgi:hypothetical protein